VVLDQHETDLHEVAFSPDSRWLATSSIAPEHNIVLWDLADPASEPLPLTSYSPGIQGLIWSHDGAVLASLGADGVAQLWHMEAPDEEPLELPGHEAYVTRGAFGPDDRWLVTADGNGEVRRWDLDTLDQAIVASVRLPGHEASIERLQITPDGAWLVTKESSGRVLVHPLTGQAPIDLACLNAGRNLTADEWAQYFPFEPYRQTCPALPVHPSAGEGG
jgi:WD40 repeat protein